MKISDMRKRNVFSKGKQKIVSPNYFTGATKLWEISNVVKSKEQKIYHVSFKNFARTKIHYHSGGQVLIATRGFGSLIMYKKIGKGKSKFKIKKTEEIKLKAGDIVYIPAKKLHTHGSVKKGDFSHIAINSFTGKNIEPKTTWYESDFKSLVSKIL